MNSLSAVTGNQAIQHVRAGLKAIYVSGWQTAADANTAGAVYPDLSLYPCDSVPTLARRINNALLRADQIHHAKNGPGKNGHHVHWLACRWSRTPRPASAAACTRTKSCRP